MRTPASSAAIGAAFLFLAPPAAMPAAPAAEPATEPPAAAMATGAAALDYSNKWRIEVSEGANSDGASRYDIEMDDGEDVLVKKDLTEPVFALELVSSTVRSVRLRVQEE